MFIDYIKAVLLIFFAEMGDKTQFLSISFATKYPIKKILLGVFIGAFLNHGIAILLGQVLLKAISGNIINTIAGFMFIYFAFNSLSIEEENDDENYKSKYGAIFTVAFAFFLGELGDKTQLTALGLSLSSKNSFLVLLGTSTGMVLTSYVGILVGLKVGKKIPENKMKIIAFSIFLIFGIEKLYSSFSNTFNLLFTILIFILLIAISTYKIKKFNQIYYSLNKTKLSQKAELLKETKKNIKNKTELLCNGLDKCKVCDGTNCLIGYMKFLLNSNTSKLKNNELKKIKSLKNKDFNKKEAKEILLSLNTYYKKYEDEYKNNEILSQIRDIAYYITFNECNEIKNRDSFSNKINKI